MRSNHREGDVSPGHRLDRPAGSVDGPRDGGVVVLRTSELIGDRLAGVPPATTVLVLPDDVSAPPGGARPGLDRGSRRTDGRGDDAAWPAAGADDYVVRPGLLARGWLRACGIRPGDDPQPSDPAGVLLAADGLAVRASALVEQHVAGSRVGGGPWSGPVALAYTLAEAGLRPRAAAGAPRPLTGRDVPADADSPAIAERLLAATAAQVPVLRSLRGITGRIWSAPVLQVDIDLENDPDAATHDAATRADLVAVTDRWLSASVEDVVVVLPQPCEEYADDPRVQVRVDGAPAAAPYRLTWPVSLLPGLRTGAGLLEIALSHGCGLVRIRTPGLPATAALRRRAVEARLGRAGTTHPDVGDLEREAGTWWADGLHLGVSATRDRPAGPVHWPRLDTEGWRRIRELESQVAQLTATAGGPGPVTARRRRRRWRPGGG